jgi:cystathionine beta-lyase/cystathionine gamma-synthase
VTTHDNDMSDEEHAELSSNGSVPVARDLTRNRSFRTRAVRGRNVHEVGNRPLTTPIYQGSVYAFDDPDHFVASFTADPAKPTYSRSGLPNVGELEEMLVNLEGGEAAVAAASGMAAIALTLLAHLDAGDHVIVSADCYVDTRALIEEELHRFDIEASFVDTCDPSSLEIAMSPRTKVVWVETISNPAIKLCDLNRLAAMTGAHGALLCVDNTFATPALCRPLEHGADLVIHSATKFLGGHHDLTAGIVVGRKQQIDRIRRCGYLFGPTLGPMDAWLALRGIQTLAPRMAWISETADAVARFLSDHPAVLAVRYPGLPGGSQDELARRLLPDGAGGVLAFDVAGGKEASDAMIRNLRLIPYAPSLGGTSTTVSYPPGHLNNGQHCSGATIRLSIGLEAAHDVIADLDQALAVAMPLHQPDAASSRLGVAS